MYGNILIVVLAIVAVVLQCAQISFGWKTSSSSFIFPRSTRLFSSTSSAEISESTITAVESLPQYPLQDALSLHTPPLKHVNDESFESEVLTSSDLAVVYFTSSWCRSPMEQTLQRVLHESKTLNKPVSFFQLDTDHNYETTLDLNVRFVPSVGIFKDGEMVSEIVGVVSAADIHEQLDRLHRHL